MTTRTIRCPNCDVTIKLRGRKTRAKSAKRVARGKRLARELPRDEKGRFLPRGSRNVFKGKRKEKGMEFQEEFFEEGPVRVRARRF